MKAIEIRALRKFPEYLKLKTVSAVTKEYDLVYDMMMKTCGTSKHKEWIGRERALYRMRYKLTKNKFDA